MERKSDPIRRQLIVGCGNSMETIFEKPLHSRQWQILWNVICIVIIKLSEESRKWILRNSGQLLLLIKALLRKSIIEVLLRND